MVEKVVLMSKLIIRQRTGGKPPASVLILITLILGCLSAYGVATNSMQGLDRVLTCIASEATSIVRLSLKIVINEVLHHTGLNGDGVLYRASRKGHE